MIIYGVALLAICTLAGVIMGDMLGALLGVKSNVGGVGIAMILLICARLWMQKRGGMTKDCEMGVGFWGAMYIPVVVAMAAQQNVVTALHGLRGGVFAFHLHLPGIGRPEGEAGGVAVQHHGPVGRVFL